ncbi:hypothetical protein E2986_12692 [Frieseomelitta varia]|uniref:UBX domain-containing protein 11 n=1 Tax=Frieseomelitta varia TaxID=561572 RepID=A0A833S2A8_9HYME|nr:hypothetical protein E2986_12692 [Frieseomelitta varia]
MFKSNFIAASASKKNRFSYLSPFICMTAFDLLQVKEWETKCKNQEILRKKEQQQRRVEVDHSEYLYKRCLMLEQRIYEMEKFLADYGLVWVGNTNCSKYPETIANNTIETCYEQIITNIDQLNLAAGKGEVHVQHNERGNGASFKTASCMSLKFYKNGMIVQDGPLRSYNDPTTLSFLRDIMDGYFPSELQEAYPEGVPFKVEDHRNQVFLNSDFPGQGYRLGREMADNIPMSSRLTRRRSNQRSNRRSAFPREKDSLYNFDSSKELFSTTARSAPKMNVDPSQFSSPHHQATVKKSQQAARSAAPSRKNAPPILHQINESSGKPGELRLKVRSLNGGTVYLVHVSADEPIARLYQLLDRAMARTVPRGYKIVLSGYSPRRLEHLGTTLREIGITRDSVLHLVND